MLPRLLIAAIVAALPLIAAPAKAQTAPSPIARSAAVASPPAARVRGRITVHPGRLLYRRCTDWYELQHRPSGTVLYPQMRCWWVRG